MEKRIKPDILGMFDKINANCQLMIFRVFSKVIFITIILIFLNSCREMVQDEFPYFNPVPVINSSIEAGKPVVVNISMAEKLDTFQLTGVDNASVLLYIDDIFSDTLNYSENGNYFSSTLVEEGRVYRCEAKIPGFDKVFATDSIPSSVRINNIVHISYGGKDEEGTIFPALKISFSNNNESKSYYEVDVRFLYGKDIENITLQTIIDPIILNEGLPIALFSNEMIKDSIYELTLNYTTNVSTSNGNGIFYTGLYPLIIEFRSISYNYYRYKKQLYLYEQGQHANGLQSSITAFPLYSNVENGYGIFAGFSAIVSDTIIPEPYVRK